MGKNKTKQTNKQTKLCNNPVGKEVAWRKIKQGQGKKKSEGCFAISVRTEAEDHKTLLQWKARVGVRLVLNILRLRWLFDIGVDRLGKELIIRYGT